MAVCHLAYRATYLSGRENIAISQEGLNLLGINEATGQLYWDGGQVRTRNMLRLGTPERWIAAFAAAGAFGTFAVNAARFVIEKLL